MFRNRVPELADWCHVIAPDRLDLGLSDAPQADEFSYPFDAPAGSLSRSQPHGGEVVLVGSIEAVEVGDGRLTAVVQLSRSGERVRLRVPAALWPSVRRYLCLQVAARGRLRRDSHTGQLLLDLLSVDLVELSPGSL